MNETRFIKTVTFGGYDKTDTEEHIKNLYTRISALETELGTTRLLLGNAENNTVIAELREKLAESQAENEKLSFSLQTVKAEKQALENEIKNLKYSVSELEHNLSDADMKILSMSQKDDTAVFGAVFASAKKSAEEIIEKARKKAENLKSDSEKLAGNIIAEANNQASEIIYDAELYATEMTAEIEEENLSAIPENIRAVILSEVNTLSECMDNFRKSFTEFLSTGNRILEESGNILTETKKTVTKGGVPVFRNIEVDLPEKPVREPVDYSYTTDRKIPEKSAKPEKKYDPVAEYYNNQDYTVQHVNDFDSYDYDYNYDENSPDFEDIDRHYSTYDDLSGLVQNVPRGTGGINFRALDRQAEEFMNTLKSEDNTEKTSGINLDDLTAQAEALTDDVPPLEKKSSGSIDLATLMAQAEALDD